MARDLLTAIADGFPRIAKAPIVLASFAPLGNLCWADWGSMYQERHFRPGVWSLEWQEGFTRAPRFANLFNSGRSRHGGQAGDPLFRRPERRSSFRAGSRFGDVGFRRGIDG